MQSIPPLHKIFLAIPCLFISLIDSARGASGPPGEPFPADQAAALDRITASSLKGHLSFLASDLLEGRDTPSRGLDLAAEYIAAQFRRASLEAIGDDGYFQTATWQLAETPPGGFSLEIKPPDSPAIRVGKELVSLERLRGFDVPAAGIVKIDAADPKALESLTPGQVAGKAVLAEIKDSSARAARRGCAASRTTTPFMSRSSALKAAAVININRQSSAATGLAPAAPPTRKTRGCPASR